MLNDRKEAGILLSKLLEKYKNKNAIVLAIPRGGIIVAYEIAKSLKGKLDLVIPRKLGAPGNEELAIGAVTEDGTLVLNESAINFLQVDQNYLKNEIQNQISEIRRRMREYRGNKRKINLKNKIVIIVDDGIATGATIKAAILSVKNQKPKKLIVAVPVGPPDVIKELKNYVDEIYCLEKPLFLQAIGNFYRNFEQVSDEEVKKLLKE